MSYTTPPTFVAGDPLAAADLNVLSADIESVYGQIQGTTFSGLQLARSGNQSIPDDADTAIVWNVEATDIGGWWTSGDTITVPASAIPAGATTIAIAVFMSGTYASNATGRRWMRLYHNGGNAGGVGFAGLSGDTTTVVVPEFTVVAAGDTIQVMAYQNSGGALNLTSAKVSLFRVGVVS